MKIQSMADSKIEALSAICSDNRRSTESELMKLMAKMSKVPKATYMATTKKSIFTALALCGWGMAGNVMIADDIPV
ncbi:hypothetical protein D3C85_1039530 [compost metagenome]